MQITITDLKDVTISGVRSVFSNSCETYKENYFEWTAFPLVSDLQTTKVMTGLLQGWHHTPNFSVIETHNDNELFYFIEGTALMLFIDIKEGQPLLETAQIVRISAGTTIEITKGKGHFVAVAEDAMFKALVVSPVQDAPRISLPEAICGQ